MDHLAVSIDHDNESREKHKSGFCSEVLCSDSLPYYPTLPPAQKLGCVKSMISKSRVVKKRDKL